MDDTIIELVGFVVAAIAIITPVMKLNSSLVRLNANFENMMKNDEARDRIINRNIEKIETNSKNIATLNHVVDNHELRIGKLEGRS